MAELEWRFELREFRRVGVELSGRRLACLRMSRDDGTRDARTLGCCISWHANTWGLLIHYHPASSGALWIANYRQPKRVAAQPRV